MDGPAKALKTTFGISLLMPEAENELRLPEIRDLAEQLHFSPSEGRIWLTDRRMILVHAEAFSALRQELVESFGPDAARGILTRIGYVAGCRDAELAWKIRGSSDSLADVWIAGAQLHSLEGMLHTEIVRGDIDSKSGKCFVEFLWKNSVESEAQLQLYGLGSEPSCWMGVGYSSGFLSTCMGKRVLVREVECRSMGAAQCRAIAKPANEWDNPEDDLKYFEPRQPDKSRPAPASSPKSRSQEPIAQKNAPDKNAPGANDIVGASASFNAILHKILRVAPTNATILLLGESGVGKSRFARETHKHSKRAQNPFIEVNCAAIPEQLIESELFGVERGAFSGATEARAGRFEIADGGTLFLDEIATLSPTAQGKLLRVLQTGDQERLGSTKTLRINVRVIAATNENLQKAVKEGRFREDLFYRLNVFPILIPPLRERKDDLPVLLEYCIDKFSKYHDRNITGVTSRALQAILSYSWPGNIRELENVIERGLILADDGSPLDIFHLFSVDGSFESQEIMGLSDMGSLVSKSLQNSWNGTPSPQIDTLNNWAEDLVRQGKATLSQVEDALVRAAVAEADGNISRAAQLLQVTRHQMDYRVKKLSSKADGSESNNA
jgi:DNA-binding NtrC family response regulator/predicted hydrocarbon binding protein